MGEFVMPSLGADMAAGTLYEWCVKPGDTVSRGQVIAEVETDKGVIEVEVWEDGTVGELLVEPGTEVPVGTVLAIIAGEGEAPAKAAQAAPEAAPAAAGAKGEPRQTARPATPQAPSRNGGRIRVSPVARRRAAELDVDLHDLEGTGPGGAITLEDVEQAVAAPAPEEKARVRVSPVARRMAEELGVDLTKVEGTGPNGCINKADVERAAAAMEAATVAPAPVAKGPEQPAPAVSPKREPAPPKREEPDFQAGMRRAIAAAMARANREIPHYYLETHIDMSSPLSWLEAENANRSVRDRLLPVVLLIKAVAKALADVPQLNAYWVEDRHQVQEAVHIGFAIALRQGGLVTPAIHHADLKSLDELMEVMRDLIKRTRAGRLRSSEMTDPTITLTNLGDMGVEKVYGVIYPPQVALVGFGKIADQPWAVNGMLGVRPIVTATLAGDHRATDGRTGAQFLDALDKHLQEPDKL